MRGETAEALARDLAGSDVFRTVIRSARKGGLAG